MTPKIGWSDAESANAVEVMRLEFLSEAREERSSAGPRVAQPHRLGTL
jgi:hypothetical protein